jgi:hypothetical protein
MHQTSYIFVHSVYFYLYTFRLYSREIIDTADPTRIHTRYRGTGRPTYETRKLGTKITCIGLNNCKNEYTLYFNITDEAHNIVNTQHYLL